MVCCAHTRWHWVTFGGVIPYYHRRLLGFHGSLLHTTLSQIAHKIHICHPVNITDCSVNSEGSRKGEEFRPDKQLFQVAGIGVRTTDLQTRRPALYPLLHRGLTFKIVFMIDRKSGKVAL